jgi:hypothetical protein
MAILGKSVATTENTHVYTVPESKRAVVLINATNTSDDSITATLSIRQNVDFEVGSVLIEDAGDNFLEKPDLLFDSSDSATAVQATAEVNTLSIKALGFTGTETGYNVGDLLTLSDPDVPGEEYSPLQVTVTSVDGGNGSIISFIISDEGSYSEILDINETFTFSGGTGVGATLNHDQVRYGILTINLTNPGSDYTTIPNIIAVEPDTDTPVGNSVLTSQMVSDEIRRYDAIEWETKIPQGSAIERSAIVLSAGDSIYAKTDTTDMLNIFVFGVEEIA